MSRIQEGRDGSFGRFWAGVTTASLCRASHFLVHGGLSQIADVPSRVVFTPSVFTYVCGSVLFPSYICKSNLHNNRKQKTTASDLVRESISSKPSLPLLITFAFRIFRRPSSLRSPLDTHLFNLTVIDGVYYPEHTMPG